MDSNDAAPHRATGRGRILGCDIIRLHNGQLAYVEFIDVRMIS